ncbi:hypothetical protein HN385_06965 [archaeon]|jgi:hypothetical protein|nr:hypothetical protein [archaeon]MBT3451014.1 hypothetical protein [archaeon]MBT6868566.1 hypothetical protein [archaeon]MBT7193098.1 hypothetical protein [archaeon]MBT7380415.1 hypothetical protein [archaeon]
MSNQKTKKNSENDLFRYKKASEGELIISEEEVKEQGNLPKKKYKAGAITATVWENKGKKINGEDSSYETISLVRVYQDKEGNWKSTNSFRLNDLPKVQLLMQKVYSDLVLKEQSLFKNNNK